MINCESRSHIDLPRLSSSSKSLFLNDRIDGLILNGWRKSHKIARAVEMWNNLFEFSTDESRQCRNSDNEEIADSVLVVSSEVMEKKFVGWRNILGWASDLGSKFAKHADIGRIDWENRKVGESSETVNSSVLWRFSWSSDLSRMNGKRDRRDMRRIRYVYSVSGCIDCPEESPKLVHSVKWKWFDRFYLNLGLSFTLIKNVWKNCIHDIQIGVKS
jgi:hypothetical protein